MARKELVSVSPAEAARADDLLSHHLRRVGMYRSKQKSVVLWSLLRSPEPISAQDLFYLVKQEDLFIGLGTVYRTLQTLVACGLAAETVGTDGTRLYAAKLDAEVCTHPHLTCKDCGALVEAQEAYE